MSNVEKIDIKKTANLAKLIVSKKEHQSIKRTVNEILQLIKKIDQIDTTYIQPLTHFFDKTQSLRKDIITETNQRELFQKNAPEIANGLYIVPRTIDREK
ncbi:Asp-tRNA(Asn)/Glu-tRNA(Gln) amidotransferase subunit GatC [Coxiella endosymbiont of Amblyomma americanum]|uniref:Asp-tRNA(Asn)/Glu-tRNA(Gln) amidotransferase subunit GatC n=1 Tax=Coxiella endosymbiont of Amblyomma americanum TaxID=325775 RepID=UPI00057D0CA0|nr:Asp-tRNA(Asn)/Glu-tRNA(Gln) amidotransferase subunit GatC [Coxiella endosymbiont of Amblyomma americanum]AJC50260.1 aspartyl/glutamyl-tRNA(Asn/Gln) amidotransferase subunit C [Coxiella endosymbiont of Amblyomma americanum]AUJ58617.1 aspartyl/glutamyl-tRNA(Asn/Gln) amidotransferase subunit C [Coxiella-like endosymbiont of Amblyomma americanum]